MSRQAVFVAPGVVELRSHTLEEPRDRQVRVETLATAISAGTEMLFYRGEVPSDVPIDETLPGYESEATYPMGYGYCHVGEVAAVGSGLRRDLVGRRVFSFRGHAEAHVVDRDELIEIPAGQPTDRAVLLPMMETAVSLVMDGQAMIGERVAVVGQGIIGALTAAVLSHTAVDELAVIDPIASRRRAVLPLCELEPDAYGNAEEALAARDRKFDLVYELSGNPAGLDAALSLLGYAGRLVLGSWYGTKPTSVDLGRLHRNRNTIHMSQVSRVAPQHSGHFNRQRRLHVALNWLDKIPVERLITHRVAFDELASAYDMIAQRPHECLQVVVHYART